jgi:thiol-disulfide isomerase/thioredoxin
MNTQLIPGLILLTFCLIVTPLFASDNEEIHIKLEKVVTDSDGPLYGMSNIFFRALQNDFKYPSEWKNPEFAMISEGDGFETVYAMRYEDQEGKVQYVVDTNSDYDFTNENILDFEHQENRSVADVLVNIKPIISNDKRITVNFQIITAESYTYARINEYRSGKIIHNGESFDVMLRPLSRGNPFYEISPWFVFLIDFNKDGLFSEQWQVSKDGNLLPSESIDMTQPFMLNKKVYEVSEIDPIGSTMIIRRSSETEALVEGFKVPNFNTVDMNGVNKDLLSYLDKPILLEFWSTSCPFCEAVRSDLNELYNIHGENFTLLVFPRESDNKQVESHLNEYPKKGTFIAHDESVWSTFNPLSVTPKFYLIDKDGTIQMKGRGTNILEPLKVMLNNLTIDS